MSNKTLLNQEAYELFRLGKDTDKSYIRQTELLVKHFSEYQNKCTHDIHEDGFDFTQKIFLGVDTNLKSNQFYIDIHKSPTDKRLVLFNYGKPIKWLELNDDSLLGEILTYLKTIIN